MAFCAARGCNKCIRQKSRALRKNGGKGEKNDSGQSRVFSIDTRRQIEAYRKQFPHITGRKIYEKLVEEGYDRLSES